MDLFVGSWSLRFGTVGALMTSVRHRASACAIGHQANHSFLCHNIYKRLALKEVEKERVTSILDDLEKYFKPAFNVTYERFIFNTCDQQSHETIDEYVNKLRGLSETCEFGTLRDSLIKDCEFGTLRDSLINK